MRIHELMTTDVITISPESSIKEAAARMVEAGVSGLVVTDDEGIVVGIVSEADFVKSEANKGSRKRAGLLRWFARASGPEIPGTRVDEIMTSPVKTVAPEAEHGLAARIMDRERVKRLPVVGEDGLVGIVSRADIVRVFSRTDAQIHDEIVNDLLPRVLWIDPSKVRVTCDEGVVFLEGRLSTKVDAELVEYMTRKLDGVLAVESNLSWDFEPGRHTDQPTLANPFQHLISR